MVKSITKLTWKIFENHGNRKENGVLTFIINTVTKEIYPIPKNIEHIDFVCLILGYETRNELKRNPSSASHLVATYLTIKEGEITKILTGFSSTEMAGGVRHTKKQINEAHKIIHKLISKGEIPLKEDLDNDEAIYQYAA